MIVVFGSINVDIEMKVERLPRPGETLLSKDYLLSPGGKGANQALAANRAGSEVRMFGMVGSDGFAPTALELMEEAGIDLSGVAHAEEENTGCATILVDSGGENCITVGAGANLHALERQVPNSVLGQDTLLLLQMEMESSQNWRLVRRAAERKTRIALNVAPAGMVPEDILRAIDILIVNETEGRHVAAEVGLDVDQPTRLPRALASRYGLTCILTLGGAGLLSFGPDGGWSVPGLPVSPTDTTAAGDALCGNLAAALDVGLPMPEALRRASVGAGLTCTVEGTQSALPTREQVEAHLGRLPESRRLV